ncbi:MAG: T9SS type A sorting domain-containing protein [Bacteroidia bacterium]
MKTKITFTYLLFLLTFGSFAQTITINPTSGNRGQRLAVSITGSGTNFARGSNTITFIKQGSATSAVNISNLSVLNNNIIGGFINIAANAPVGAYSVRITNPQNTTINLTNGFSVTQATPSLLAIAPNTATQGQSLAVSITGVNTNFNSASNTVVKFFSQGTESFDIYEIYNTPFGNTLLTANILVSPLAPLGVYSVGVENEIDGLVMLNNSFTVGVSNKSITSITPNRGKQNETLTVTITGVNTQFNTGSPTLYFIKQGSQTSDIEALSFTATSATSASVQLSIMPNANIGLYDIVYFNLNEGTIYKPNIFTVDLAIGMNEITENTTKIYPNPAKNLLNIESKNNITNIQIFDLMGKEILNKIPEKQTQNLQLDLTQIEIPKGIYFIKVQSLEGLVTKKIVIE